MFLNSSHDLKTGNRCLVKNQTRETEQHPVTERFLFGFRMGRILNILFFRCLCHRTERPDHPKAEHVRFSSPPLHCTNLLFFFSERTCLFYLRHHDYVRQLGPWRSDHHQARHPAKANLMFWRYQGKLHNIGDLGWDSPTLKLYYLSL